MKNNSPLLFLQQRLENTILQLQTNQILQQMRRDQSLQEFKLQHARQIIRQQLKLEPLVEQLTLQNDRLNDMLASNQQKCEEMLSRQSNAFAEQLGTIEKQWQAFRVQKEKEKKQLESKYQHEGSDLSRELSHIKSQVHRIKNQLFNVKAQNQHLKEDRLKLEQHKVTSQENILKIKRQLAQKQRDLEHRRNQIDSRTEFDRGEYEEIIAKMQQDMHLIRESWQKRCQQIESHLRQENSLMALQYEQKMRKELKEYAQSLKLGKSVVISDSEEIISKRVERVQQEYVEQIRKIEDQMESLTNLYHTTKEQIESRDNINKELKKEIRNYELEIQKVKKELEIKIQTFSMDVDSFKQERVRFDSEIKGLKEQMSQIKKQKKELKDEHNSTLKKYNSLCIQHEKIDQQVKILNSKVVTLSATNQQAMKQIKTHQQNINQMQQTSSTKDVQLSNAKAKVLNLEQSLDSEKQKNQTLSQIQKKQKAKTKKLVNTIDKLHTALRKVRKQCQILRQDVNSRFSMLKGKWSLESTQLIDYINQFKQQNERKCKSKMTELIDQLEVKQKQLIQTLQQDKELLKASINQKDEIVYKKEEEANKYKARLSGSELQKKQILEQLQKEKLAVIRYQQKMEHNQQLFYGTINKLQKDISRNMNNFHFRWSDNLAQVQSQLDTKEGQIKLCLQNLDELSAEVEQQRKRKEWAQDQIKKYKKKYQALKNQRDQEIKSYLKKFDQQSKHRINLQRQLKDVRLSIMRGTTNNSVSNFSFNNQKQSYYNPNTNHKHLATREDNSNYHEKQLSEIKDMIAKTNKYFGEQPSAERDITRHVSKKHLF